MAGILHTSDDDRLYKLLLAIITLPWYECVTQLTPFVVLPDDLGFKTPFSILFVSVSVKGRQGKSFCHRDKGSSGKKSGNEK